MDDTLRFSIDKGTQEIVLMRIDTKNPDVILSSFVLKASDAEMIIMAMLDLPDVIKKIIDKLERDGFVRPSHDITDIL